MRNRRAWGYVVDISQHTSENTPTPYLFTVVARLAYLRGGETDFSSARARVPTYAPNFLTSEDAPIQERTPSFDIRLPTFGSYTDAAFATWETGSLAGWRNEGLRPAVFTSDVCLDPWSWAPLPSLGDSAFFTKKLLRVSPACALNLRSWKFSSLTTSFRKTLANPIRSPLPLIQSNYY